MLRRSKRGLGKVGLMISERRLKGLSLVTLNQASTLQVSFVVSMLAIFPWLGYKICLPFALQGDFTRVN